MTKHTKGIIQMGRVLIVLEKCYPTRIEHVEFMMTCQQIHR